MQMMMTAGSQITWHPAYGLLLKKAASWQLLDSCDMIIPTAHQVHLEWITRMSRDMFKRQCM